MTPNQLIVEAETLLDQATLRPQPPVTRGLKAFTARDAARQFLVATLRDGPVSSQAIAAGAKANGVALRTLFRAKNELGVMAKRDSPNGAWRWYPSADQVFGAMR